MRKFQLCKRIIAGMLACFITLSVFSCITFAQTTDGVVVETTDGTTTGDDWGDTVPDEGGGGDNIPDEDLGEIPDEGGNEGIGGEGDGDLEDGTGGSDDQDKIDYTTAVSVSTAEELEQALANKEPLIRIDANFNLDRTFYIISDVIIFSEEAHTLLRSVNFGADIFVVGENPDGTATEKAVTFTLGKPDSSDEELLIIDGNKDNMTVDVVGSVIFVDKNSTANLYCGLTIQNCKKVGNEKTLLGTYGVSYPIRVGGAVAIVSEKAKMNIYGGYYVNNGVNEVADDNNTCIQGGVIYNFGTTSIYGGTFSGNRSTHGGAFFNYRKMYVYNATISDNFAGSLGGAIYVPNSTGAFLYIGQENDVVESDVTFSGNTADDGGAIYARNVLNIENATFANNTTSGYGGAIIAYTPKATVDNSVFYNNKASYGGAIYVSGNNNAYDEVELNITNTIFESNTATSYGGALAVVSEARLYATKVDFIENHAKYSGAVYASNGSVEIDEATFTDNTSTSHGAVIGAYEGAKVLLNNVTADGNAAGESGGFAMNTGADLTIYNSTILNNSAKKIGGAIYYYTNATGGIYATSFKNNTAKGNAGAVGVYTGGTKVLMHSCTFENNVSSAYGGAIFVSGKSLLDLYNITAVKNTGSHGGFMYETAASTVVTAIGITVSENTATTGGNTIWGNTLNAKLYIDISKYVDLSYDGDWDEDYWASAVANLLKIYEISEDLPSYIDYKTGEEISPPAPSVTANISSASQLERALKAKLGKINLTADISVDRTFYVTSSVTIFSEEGHALIRATDFGGDILVVGESADGKVVSGGATLKLGDPDASEQGVLTIDGNKDNMTVDVVGSAIFVVKNSTADLYESVTIKNCKKVGNERTLLGTYGVSYPIRIGGSVAIVSEKANMNIYGGTYTDNAVNETSDDQLTCIQGGAIYNFGTLKIYGGTFSGNRSVHGGVLFNYRKTYIYNATISGNHAESLGGAIYIPNSTGAFLYVGDENEIVESAVTFEDNSADSDGGAIYARNYLSLKNATFKNNTSKGEGGAIMAYSLRMFVENTLFEGNTSATSGGALYVEGSNSREDVLELNLTATTLKNNTSSSYGGAIYLKDARAKAVLTDFIGNSAKYTGAVYCTNANLEINGSTVENNTATSNAGAFGLYAQSTALLNNISADGNSGSNGGFAYVNASNLDIYNSTINNNTASGTHGGAIYYATDASGGVYATKFEGNHSANQGGAISVYTGGTSVLLHSCNFESNIAEGFGGAVFVSGKSILDMYNNVGTNNRGSHGGFMYETAASTVVKCIGLTVSGNSATTGGNIIWGNTLNAKLYINKAKYSDEDFSGSLNDVYWASAIANKLTVIEISDEVPKYLDYGNESYEHMKDAVDVSSAEQLEKALALGTPHIRIVADFVIDRTFYISSNTTIFSTIERTLTRADDFAGDIFIVGETENGSILNEVGTIKFVLGNPLSIKEDLLTIDGNRDNMTVPVHGTVLFVGSGSKVDLHPNITVINALKTSNEHILTDTHKISSAYKAGGAVSIIANGTLSIYGGKYKNNSSNVELGVTEEGKYDYTSTMGGAFYNYSNLTIYDGIFENNHSYSGGFLYNYCNLKIYGGNIIGNHSTKNGGAIYNANTSISHAFIGTDADSSSSNVLFENNTCDINGGAIYSPLLSVLNLYGNTTFRGNEIFSGHGGAIYLNGSFTARDTVFENNIAVSRGGAIYNNKNHRTYDTRIVSITDCTFINNTAASGGAILLYASSADYPEGSIASITGCRFENNHATSSGGAIYSDRKSQLTITDTTFEGNHSEGQGGTLYGQGESVVKISGSTIKSSTANSHGGAIALHSAYLDLINVDIIGSMSSNNGGAIYISYSSSSEMNSKVNIENCNIKDSISHSYGGAVYITRHSIDNEHRILTIKNSEISSNTAQYGGGAVYSASKVDAYFKNVDFIGNGTVSEGSDGGAICAKGSYLTFDTVNFTDNFAMQLGGAVYMDSGAVVVMNNIIASNNTADGSGGFLYTNGSELKVFDSTISENYSSVNGGAIAFYDDSVSKIYNTLFEKNYSVENGGAIVVYTGGTECMLHSCSFNGNTSENFGGAMYVSGSGLLNLYNTTAEGNTALKGGMLYETTTGTSVTINGITVKGNTATDSGNIIFGNSTGAVLNLNKSNYIDYDKGELDAEYWETLVANKLTVNYVTGSIPKAETYKGESETKPKDPVVKQPVLVDDVLSLGISSSDEDINSTYNALPRLDNSSNFMSKQTTKFPNINGETVTVDSLVYPAKSKADNPNCSQGLLIYQAILYKQAHPEEDVYIDAASYRFSVQAAVNINRNSRYFGYMRDLEDREYDKYGFVRISYLLITAAKMGINVTVIGHRDGYPVSAKALNLTDYFTTKLNDPCDPNYVENGVIGDYLDFHYIKWTLGQNKGGTDMMHTKLCAVSHYLDKDGNAHKNAVYTSSSNLDGIKNGVNGNWKLQTGTIISDHEQIYRASVNYLTLIAAYEEQGEIYEFQDIVNKRSTEQVDLILEGKANEIPLDEQIVYVGSETDNVFELYFTPLGGGRLAWEDKYNPYCKYIRKLYNSEDYIGFVWNAAEYSGKYTLGLQMERMITEAFHKNRNVKNSIYTIMESFDSTVFDDLKVGVDIGYKSFNKHDFGEIHNKDLLFSYVEGGERYFVSLLNSTNIHSGSMSYQSNFAIVIKETDGCSKNSVFYTMAENTASGNITEHYYGETKRYEPTETEDGYTYKECKGCGKQEKINVIHKEGEWIIDRVPTASLRGIKHKECEVCGVTLESSELLYEEENSVDVSDINGKTFDETKESLISLDVNEMPLTFEATIQLDGSITERAGVIVGNYATDGEPQINFEIYHGGKPRLYYVDSNKGKVDCLFDTDIRSSKPKNVAITIDGNTVRLYVDGKLKETKTTNIAIETGTTTGFKVGGDNRSGNVSHFKGTIYYLNMFNEVRSEGQIAKDQLFVIDNPSSLIYSSRFSESRSNSYFATELSPIGKTFNAAQSSTINRSFDVAPRTLEAVVLLPESASSGTIVGNMGEKDASTINLEVAKDARPQITIISDSGEKCVSTFETNIAIGTPTHIAVTLDNGTATLYVNGAKAETVAVSVPLPENATDGYHIGGDAREGNTNYFTGTIYSVNMFSDLRTSTEIKHDISAVLATADELLYSGYFVNEETKIEGKTFTENVMFSVAENFEQTPKTIEAIIQVPKSISGRAGVIIGNYANMNSTNVLNVEIMENGKPRLFFINEKGEKVSHIFKEDIRSANEKHIAITIDGNIATLYVDGVKSESATLSAALPENATKNFKIGGDNRTGNTQYFHSIIYSVNLFSDVRTSQEISEDAKDLPQNRDALMYSKAFTKVENTLSSVTGKTFDQKEINKVNSTFEKAPKTIEAYINVPKELEGRAGAIIGNYTNGTSKNVINLEVLEYGKVRLFTIDGKYKRNDCVFNVDIRSDSPVHIAVTANEKQATLYVNGVKAETATLTTVLPEALEGFVIGGDNRQNNAQYFKGTIYSVNLFGDVRTQEEVLKDFASVSADEDELLYSNDFSQENQVTTMLVGKTFKKEIEETVGKSFTATPKTIEAVIQLSKDITTRGGVIVGNYKSATDTNVFNLEVIESGKLRLFFVNEKGEKANTGFKTDVRSDNPSHIAVTISGKTATLYLNGKQCETITFPYEPPVNATKNLVIGGDNRSGNTQYFKGTIYSLNMFSAVRSAADIATDVMFVDTSDENIIFSRYYMNTIGLTPVAKGEGKRFTNTTLNTVESALTKTPATFEATIKLPKTFDDRAGVIVGNYGGASSAQINLEVYTHGRLRLYYTVGAQKITALFKTDIRSSKPVHIAVTVEGKLATLYVNGKKAESVSLSYTLPSNATTSYCIGGDNRKGNAQYFKGTIYSINLYSSVRTAAEILNSAANGTVESDTLLYSNVFDSLSCTKNTSGSEHEVGDWIIDYNATETEKGIKHLECTLCGKTLKVSEIGKMALGDNCYNISGGLVPTTALNKTGTLSAAPKTFEMTVQLPPSFSDRAGVIIGNYTGGNENQINIEVYTNGQLRLYCKTGGNAVSYVFKTDIRSIDPVHIAIATSGLKANLYIDGVYKETVNMYRALPSATEKFCIGGDNRSGNVQYFKGIIHSVNIFSDERTAEEIAYDAKLVTSDTEGLVYSKYYCSNQRVPYDLEGKTIVNFGDSIFGNYVAPVDISTMIANKTGATVYNVGFGGAQMSETSNVRYNAFGMENLADAITTGDFSLQEKHYTKEDRFVAPFNTLKSIDFNSVDIITIAYGTNDFAKSKSLDDVKNAAKYSIETILNKYPHIDIVLCIPVYRYWIDDEGNFIEDSNTKEINGIKLTDYIQLYKEIGKEYGLVVIDNYNGSGITASNRVDCFTGTDTTHPNETGRQMIAEYMSKELYKYFG